MLFSETQGSTFKQVSKSINGNKNNGKNLINRLVDDQINLLVAALLTILFMHAWTFSSVLLRFV